MQNIFIGYYDAWGVCTVVNDETEEVIVTVNPFRYRSYYYDSETGMYYLQSRYYDPVVGRFINADDVSIMINIMCLYEMYTYCSNTPINRIDSYGYKPLKIYPYNTTFLINKFLKNKKKKGLYYEQLKRLLLKTGCNYLNNEGCPLSTHMYIYAFDGNGKEVTNGSVIGDMIIDY